MAEESSGSKMSWIARYGVPSLILSVAVFVFQQQQQTFLPQQGFPISAYGGPAGWLAGTPGVQPQVFGGQAGYVM